MEKEQRIFTCESGYIELNGIALSLSPEQFQRRFAERGFTTVDDMGDPVVIKGKIDGLGVCFLKIFGGKGSMKDSIGLVIVSTEHKYSEDEMMAVFEQVKEELPGSPLYDDGGYGVLPKPHEIRHFWDFKQGYVTINWDGGPDGDGCDNITFWLRKPIVKDEAYWRSEVD